LGDHKRLIPILQEYRHENCYIVTYADDYYVPKRDLLKLVSIYFDGDSSCIASTRAREIGLCNTKPWLFTFYDNEFWPYARSLKPEHLVIPETAYGALFQPKYFSDSVFHERFLKLTKEYIDIAYRFATMMQNIAVISPASIGDIIYSSDELLDVALHNMTAEAVRHLDGDLRGPAEIQLHDYTNFPLTMIKAAKHAKVYEKWNLLKYMEDLVRKERARCYELARLKSNETAGCSLRACRQKVEVAFNKMHFNGIRSAMVKA